MTSSSLELRRVSDIPKGGSGQYNQQGKNLHTVEKSPGSEHGNGGKPRFILLIWLIIALLLINFSDEVKVIGINPICINNKN